MKTVLSLHRKWAHAVKTIRILQGLVSAPPLPPLGFEQVFGSGSDGGTKVFWRRLECESVGRMKSVGVLCFLKWLAAERFGLQTMRLTGSDWKESLVRTD